MASQTIYRVKHILAYLIVLFAVTPTFAHNLVFHPLTINQGLSQNTVQCIIQDQKGFMWFGTQDGLNRYDGYNFRAYRSIRGDSTSISDNFITALYEDKKGFIWIGTNSGGLNRFDPSTNKFKRYLHNPAQPKSISCNNIHTISADTSGNILIGTIDGGISVLNPKKNEFVNYLSQPSDPLSIPSNNISSIFVSGSGEIWVGMTNDGFAKFYFDEKKKSYFKHYAMGTGLNDNRVTSIAEERPGVLLIGTVTGGLNRFNISQESFEQFRFQPNDASSISGNYINVIYKDRQGVIWVGTDNSGLNDFHYNDNSFYRITHQSLQSNTISSNQILSIYEDRSGIIWVGTRDRGLNQLQPQGNKFQHFKNNPRDRNSLAFNTVRSFYNGKNDVLWIGTFGSGVDRFDRKKEEFTHYHSDFTSINALNNNHISALWEDQQGTVWIGTWGGGLNKMTTAGQFSHFTSDPQNPESISDNHIQVIFEDEKEGMWIGTEYGLNFFNKNKAQFKQYLHNPDDTNSISDNRVQSNCILKDPFGYLWVGTWNGLNRISFDAKSKEIKQVQRFWAVEDQQNSLSDNRIISMLIDQTQLDQGILTIWVGTYTGGLNRMVIHDANAALVTQVQYTRYGVKDGLPSDVIYGILQDGSGNVWFSTNKGLCRFNPNMTGDNRLSVYKMADGLQSNQFFWGAAAQNTKGEMIFGGINGFNIFHPDSIKHNLLPPPVVFTRFKRYNKDIELSKDISALDEVVLEYNERVFSIEFAALDFTISSENQYAYTMEGFDKDWILAGNKHEATYTNLDPGKYTFRVKGSNNDGVWNEEGASIKIRILPPWWMTWWFRVLSILFVIGIIVLIYRIRISGIKQRNADLKEHNLKLNKQIEKSELLQKQLTQAQKMESVGTLAGGVAHDFNNLLTVINGHAELAMLKKDVNHIQKDLKAIFESGKRAITLTSQLLAFSRKQVVQLVPLDMNEIIHKFEKMLRRLIGEDISIITELDPDLPKVKADPGQLEQILMNLVINARDAINDPKNAGSEKRISIKTRAVTLDQEFVDTHVDSVQGTQVELSICDSGAGMSVEAVEKIFDPFYTTKSQGKGTGLGLSTVYGIVKQNQANILVDSKPGEGSTFKIYWPITESSEVKKQTKFETGQIQKGTEHILLVEDDQGVRTYVQESLVNMGYEVKVAVSGEDALQVLSQTETAFDLLITDMIMPGMNGQELAEQILSHFPTIKVLYSSGYTDNHIVNEGFLEEGLYFLQKPYTISALSEKVRQILDQD